MLKVKNIKKTFHPGTPNEKQALRGISLTLEEGQFCTVIGSNGAGKSTLLNAVAGAFMVDEGEIYLGERNVTSMPEHIRAKYIGRVFQDPMLGTAAGMMIEENLDMAFRRGKWPSLAWSEKKALREMFRDRLKELDLGLENRLNAKVGLLSGGQRQAVTLLMATLVRPELLLLDEHTAALDPKTAEKVLQMTNRVVEEQGLTTLMITHNMRDALRFGNRLIMMHNGQIVVDVDAATKATLKPADLLALFEEHTQQLSDAMVLAH